MFAPALPVALAWSALGLAQPAPAQPAPVQRPITRISFSRNPCYGFCPSYSVALERDGTATWKEGNYVSRPGERSGRIAPEQFKALVGLLDAPTFPALLARTRGDATKTLRATDGAGFSLVVERGDQKTEIEDYGFRAPAEFLSIEKKLDAAAQNIAWRPEDTGIIEAPAKPSKNRQIFFVSLTTAPTGFQEVARGLVVAGQRFQVTLPPGDYAVEWQKEGVSQKRQVKVIEGYFTSLAP